MLTIIQAAMLPYNTRLYYRASDGKTSKLRVINVRVYKKNVNNFNGSKRFHKGDVRLTLYSGIYSTGYWYVGQQGIRDLYFAEELGYE